MVFKIVTELIAERNDWDISKITRETTFKSLSIDSLDLAELLMNLEDKIDMEIELDQNVETVGEFVDFIESKMGNKK